MSGCSSAASSPAGEESGFTVCVNRLIFIFYLSVDHVMKWQRRIPRISYCCFFSSQAGEQTPSAPHQKTRRLTSQRWRAATASVHPAGQMNSRRLRSSSAVAPPPTSPCPAATAYLTLPSTPATTALCTATRGGRSAARSKERSPR